MIDVAVVPAAGRGSRLGALTSDVPKPMLDVGGRPAVLRVLDDVAAAGIERAVVVTGYLAHRVEAGLAGAPLEVVTVRQERPDGTATAVLAAREIVGEVPFLVTWGDALRPRGTHAGVVEAFDGADAAIAVNRVADPSAGAAVWLDDGMVSRIVEKPPAGNTDTPWNNAGILALPAAAWGHIAGVQPSARGEYELTDAIASMLRARWRIAAVPVDGPRIDIGTPETLELARRVFGSADGMGTLSR